MIYFALGLLGGTLVGLLTATFLTAFTLRLVMPASMTRSRMWR